MTRSRTAYYATKNRWTWVLFTGLGSGKVIGWELTKPRWAEGTVGRNRFDPTRTMGIF